MNANLDGKALPPIPTPKNPDYGKQRPSNTVDHWFGFWEGISWNHPVIVLFSDAPCIDQDNSNGRLLWNEKHYKSPPWKAAKRIYERSTDHSCWVPMGPDKPNSVYVCELGQEKGGILRLRGGMLCGELPTNEILDAKYLPKRATF